MGKKCRNRTYAGYCHLHVPSVTEGAAEAEAAVTINI